MRCEDRKNCLIYEIDADVMRVDQNRYAGDRDNIKKYAMNYVIGAIILFGAAGILGIVQKFVETALK